MSQGSLNQESNRQVPTSVQNVLRIRNKKGKEGKIMGFELKNETNVNGKRESTNAKCEMRISI